MTMQINLTLRSSNSKTGPIPVSTTSNETCPDACPLKANGCYAEGGPLGILWRKVSSGSYAFALSFEAFCERVQALPAGTFWRHNQAGDLPGANDTLDCGKLAALVAAQRGKRGFTYTHKPLRNQRERQAIAAANRDGFTINLSGNNLAHADTLADLQIAPVVVVLPDSVRGNVHIETPAGRRVVVCPATYRDDVSCASCQLCQRTTRACIVGFPAHGAAKRKASTVATSTTN